MQRLEELARVELKNGRASFSGDVDVWYWSYERDLDQALFDSGDQLLTAAERDRHQAFLFESDRRMFLATRVLVRTALSHYAPVAPRDWRFSATMHGKPYISGPSGVVPDIHFNLANVNGLVVCAISTVRSQVGVDVEGFRRPVDTAALADSVLSPAEAADWRALPKERQHERFLRYWTLKESYAKARGVGLTLPFDRISFRLNPQIQLEQAPELEDHPARWRFAQLHSSSHVLAVCVESGKNPLHLRGMDYRPGREAVWQQWASQP